MKQWKVKTYAEFLAKYNTFGLDFFNQKDFFLQNLSKTLEIEVEILNNPIEGLHDINQELCANSLYLNDPNRQRDLTQKLASELFFYLIFYDECKNNQYKIKTQRAVVKSEFGYCPTLLDSKGQVRLGTLSFCRYNLDGLLKNDYWDILSSYGNPRIRAYSKTYEEVDRDSYEIVIIT